MFSINVPLPAPSSSEQLRRCMPQLPVFAVFLFVQLILKLGISLPQHAVELRLVWYSVELERLTWVEDGHVLAEIAIMGIVQAVLNEVPHEHLHPPRPFSPPAGKWSAGLAVSGGRARTAPGAHLMLQGVSRY
ncbi:hypothetical protein KC323_g153 [Hortaea werneckii]|nr:hypothetical protein KC323_g153 [Hortaea werneckii]